MSISAQSMIDAHTESGIVYARWRQIVNKVYEALKKQRDNPLQGVTSVRVRITQELSGDFKGRVDQVMVRLNQELKYEGYSVEYEYGNVSPFEEIANIPTHIVVSWG